jgi:hypothetical protein
MNATTQKINEAIANYTAGKASLEDTNARLKALGDLYLDPEKNVIKPDEIGRFGLLNNGTGSAMKIPVADFKIPAGNVAKWEVATVLFNGKKYHVRDGVNLVEAKNE